MSLRVSREVQLGKETHPECGWCHHFELGLQLKKSKTKQKESLAFEFSALRRWRGKKSCFCSHAFPTVRDDTLRPWVSVHFSFLKVFLVHYKSSYRERSLIQCYVGLGLAWNQCHWRIFGSSESRHWWMMSSVHLRRQELMVAQVTPLSLDPLHSLQSLPIFCCKFTFSIWGCLVQFNLSCWYAVREERAGEKKLTGQFLFHKVLIAYFQLSDSPSVFRACVSVCLALSKLPHSNPLTVTWNC